MNAFQLMMTNRLKTVDSNSLVTENKKKVSKRKGTKIGVNGKPTNDENSENVKTPNRKKRKFNPEQSMGSERVTVSTENTSTFSPRTWRMKIRLRSKQSSDEDDNSELEKEDIIWLHTKTKRKLVSKECTVKSLASENKSIVTLKSSNCNTIGEEPILKIFSFISHEQQKSNDSFWNLPRINNNNNRLINDFAKIELQFKSVRLLNLNNNDNTLASNSYLRITRIRNEKQHIKNRIEELKCECPNYPVYKTFRLLRSRATDNGLLWTEKYKPELHEEFIGNSAAASQINTWLLAWKNNNVNRNKINDYDSSSSCSVSSNASFRKQNNTLLLIGGHGVGKTVAVYALCKELNINVLEINASARRTGKMLQKKVQEATQSHRVNRTLSLIFIKDIDVIFDEHDDGFISSLLTLVVSSKRPLILTAADPKSLHVQKFVEQCQIVRFPNVPGRLLDVWFEIVCLLEGFQIERHQIRKLLDLNGGDVRKTIIYLQFCIETNQVCLDRNIDFHVPVPIDLGSIWWRIPQQQLSIMIFDCISFADSSNSTSSMIDCTEPIENYNYTNNRMIDSLSVDECFQMYNESEEILIEMKHWLLENSFKQYCNLQTIESDRNVVGPSADQLCCREKEMKVMTEISTIVPMANILDRNAFATDYLAACRAISRSEYERFQSPSSSGNKRRRNRFYHYFKNFNIHLTENMCTTLCNAMQSK